MNMLFEKNREIFRSRLKKLLKDKDLTQKQFAEIMEVSQPTVSNWLDGSKLPYYDKVQKMSEIFNVDISYLMGEERGPYIFKTIEGPFKFNNLEIDIEKNIYKIDGETLNGVDYLKIIITALNVEIHTHTNKTLVFKAEKNTSK